MSGNLIRCQNGHLFSSRRYGTVCPYCNIETATKEKKSGTEKILWDGQMIWTFRFWGITKSHGEIMR